MRRIWGFLMLSALVMFFLGLYTGDRTMVIVGGLLMVLEDLGAIQRGILKPGFPVILSLILVIFVRPWYYGIFWASAVFKILDIPTNIGKMSGN